MASLKIEGSQLNDIGDYTVVAENEAGRDQSHCNVFVAQEPGIDQRPIVNPDAFKYLQPHMYVKKEEEQDPRVPPKVIVPLHNAKIHEGQTLFLASKIIGTPKPKVNALRPLSMFKNNF